LIGTRTARLPHRAGFAVPGALALWAGILVWGAGLPPSGVALLSAQALAILLLMRAVAPEADRPTVTGFYLAALLLYTAEALFVQGTGQWEHAHFDSRLYDLNARALAMHWEGGTVPAAEFDLKGLLRNGIARWAPGDAYSYAEVFGSSRYGYQLYAASIYALTGGSTPTAVFGNLPFAAGTAAGTYLLALALFGQRRGALLGAGLVLADPALAVWSAILMRDVMIAFFAVLALLGGTRLLRGRESFGANVALAAGASGILAVLRFNAVAALLTAGLCAALSGRNAAVRRRIVLALAGVGAVVAGLILAVPDFGRSWEQSLPGQMIRENLEIFRKSRLTVEAATGIAGSAPQQKIDVVRREWHAHLRDEPLWVNLARAMARSFMGPFPWVALTHGISGTNYYELLFPGMTLWIAFLPAFLYALWRMPVRGDPAVLFCLAWLATALAIYIVGYGQLDGRNRLMVQSLLWIFAARGTVLMASRWPERFLSRTLIGKSQ
jgi:hypothetical protein